MSQQAGTHPAETVSRACNFHTFGQAGKLLRLYHLFKAVEIRAECNPQWLGRKGVMLAKTLTDACSALSQRPAGHKLGTRRS